MNFSEILNWGEGQEIKQGLYEEGHLEYLKEKVSMNACNLRWKAQQGMDSSIGDLI